jgi:hypothetical protein
MTDKYRCTQCGCLWRLNPSSHEQPENRFWSLYDHAQKPCKVCDNSPAFLANIDPVESA